MLPKLHGFDLTQKIYEETKGNLPVVIVTGLYKGPQYKNEALRSFGAADYFEKPFDNQKLVNSVLNLLHGEVEIDEKLPTPKEVIDMVAKMMPAKKPSAKKK
jgi:DNA-binding response OmpR family regulator